MKVLILLQLSVILLTVGEVCGRKTMKLVRRQKGGKGRTIKRRKIVNKIDNTEMAKQVSSPRFLNPFSLFSLVSFPNTECSSSSGISGTCYTGRQCTDKGGKSDGQCAGGFGVCCTFANDCNTETSENGTYFSNPSTVSSVCSLMIRPMNDNICQVRLEIENLQLADPDANGKCVEEYLQVTGGVGNSGKIPVICGTNNGQHIIYTAIPNFPARLSIVVDAMNTAGTARTWKIQVLQHECNSPSLAPDGCLQYFTGIVGNVSSFNWKITDNTNPANTDKKFPNHLANLDYSVCVRTERGYCTIEWSTPTPYEDQAGAFFLSGKLATATPALAKTNVKTGDADCDQDYLTIPRGWGGTDTNNIQQAKDRFCGQALGFKGVVGTATTPENNLGAVRSGVTPFILGVITDSGEPTDDEANKGFRLNFRQHPCSGSSG